MAQLYKTTRVGSRDHRYLVNEEGKWMYAEKWHYMADFGMDDKEANEQVRVDKIIMPKLNLVDMVVLVFVVGILLSLGL